jgi:hypothetical protein
MQACQAFIEDLTRGRSGTPLVKPIRVVYRVSVTGDPSWVRR